MLAGPGLEEQFLARARFVPLSGFKVPVISPEDLIVTKVLAGRPKDIEDVRGILKRQLQKLNLDQIDSTLALLEQALERGDLRPLLAAQLAAVDDGDS